MVDTMRRAEINGIVGAGGWAMRNRIINGDMRVDQRNAGASVTAASPGFVIDRWLQQASAGSLTVQRTASVVPAGFSYAYGITVASVNTRNATDYSMFSQNIEGINLADMDFGLSTAAAVTLSFWVRSSIAGLYSGVLGSGDNNRSYGFTYTINSANTWEQKTITIAGDTSGGKAAYPTDNTTGLRLKLDLGGGSNYQVTAGSWQAAVNKTGVAGTANWAQTAGATFYITGVQLEKGSYATPFDFRPIGTELALCQRYYYKYNTQNWAGIRYSGTSPWMTTNFPVTMRATPTVATSFASLYCTTGTLNSMPVYSATVDGVSIYFYTSNISTDFGAALSYTSSAEL
jgi:hypothetical protein